MKNNNIKNLHIITFVIILLSIIISAIGLLYVTEGKAYNFVNQYGDTIKMYGNGLYAHDSYFVAPIFRGTDFTILFFAIPALIIALLLDVKKNTLKSRLFLTSVISIFTYYSANIALGITYNVLHLAYIALFSVSVFGLISAIGSLDKKQVAENINESLKYKGIYIFLWITGIALIVAWLPDVITSLVSGKSLQLIEVYTTAITYVLDMGIIAPAAFICLHELKKKTGMGYILLAILLTICAIMGVMLPIQTIFQISAGIVIPLPAIITKVGIFVLLAIFALKFDLKLFKNIKS